MEQEPRTPLEQTLSYWKAHFTVHDVLASELSYSLIYNNIQPEKLDDALSTVGLTTLPSRILLFQVDNYLYHSSKLRSTQEYFQKTNLLNLLREHIRAIEMPGFASNLIGKDKVICFLCPAPEQNKLETLSALAADMQAIIRQNSPYTVSVCISQPCTQLSQFSRQFPRMEQALDNSYFSGKECCIPLSTAVLRPSTENQVLSSRFYPDLQAAILRRSREQFCLTTLQMLQAFQDSTIRPQRAKLEILRLLQHLEHYCIGCGIPEEQARHIHDRTMEQVLTCSFLFDVGECLEEYFLDVTAALHTGRDTDIQSFRVLVEEYIASHYSEDLRPGILAALLNYSEGLFARTFRKEFGTTFVQHLTQFRIDRSKELLRDSALSIEQIAYQVGIGNYSYFCTCFKQATGDSPGVFRKKTQKNR